MHSLEPKQTDYGGMLLCASSAMLTLAFSYLTNPIPWAQSDQGAVSSILKR